MCPALVSMVAQLANFVSARSLRRGKHSSFVRLHNNFFSSHDCLDKQGFANPLKLDKDGISIVSDAATATPF